MAKSKSFIDPQFGLQDLDMVIDKSWAVSFLERAYLLRGAPTDASKLSQYRDLDLGISNEAEMKARFDPKSSKNPEGGKAEFVNTDWSSCPLIQSVNRITKSYIINKMADISVRGIDKISIDKKMAKRQQDILRQYVIDTINFIGGKLGDAPLPSNYNINSIADESLPTEVNTSLIEQVRMELANNDMSFALLSEVGALKDGVELTHEIMTNYYLDSLKFRLRILDDVVSDIMKANIVSYRFYTSAMDGTPQVIYIDPLKLNVGPFVEKDSRDKDYWFYEDTITWGEWMKMVGGKLDESLLKEVYEANRNAFFPNNSSYPVWNNQSYTLSFQNAILNTAIRIGYFECKKHVYDEKTGKYYDQIIKFYYLPITGGTGLSYNEKFIFELGPLQDMYRFGGMLQYSDFSLVLYRDNSMSSWYEVQEPSLHRLNYLWNQYLNTATAIVPRGVIFSEETLREIVDEMVKAVEEDMAENGQEITGSYGRWQKMMNETIKKYVQSGRGIFKRRSGDANEKQLDPPTFSIQHQIYDDLQRLIQEMMSLYNMMIMSLGTNPVMLGQAPKQHQTLKGIELASQSTGTMLEQMSEMAEAAVTEFGRRMIYYNQSTAMEFGKDLKPKTPRAEQMAAIIGTQGVGWQEIGRDMPVQQCTFLIENRPTDEQRILLFDYTMQLEQKGLVPVGTALMVQEIKNYKLAKLYVMANVAKQQRVAVENQMQLMERQTQQAQMMNQQAMAQQAQMMKMQNDLKNENDALKAQLKEQGMSKNIQERGENRIEENAQKAAIDLQKKEAESQMKI
jgi:hypothetical protein